MFALLLILILLAVFGYLAWNRYRMMTLRDRLGIPGPKAHFLFGNVPDFVESFKKCDQVNPLFQKWRREYGEVFGVYFGPKLYIIFNDIHLVKEILVKQFSSFEDRPGIPFMAHKPLSEMLNNLTGEKWKQLRNMLTPTFTTSKLKQMSPAVDKVTDVFLDIIEKHEKNGDTFDIYKQRVLKRSLIRGSKRIPSILLQTWRSALQALTLDVIGKCAFATDVQSQTNPNDPFLKTVQTFMQELSMQNSIWLKLCFLFPELNNFFSYFRPLTKTGKAEKWIFDAIEKVIEARKPMLHQFKSVDVLQVLLEQNEIANNNIGSTKQIEIKDSTLVANVFVFLVAGYETTSTSLSYTIWLLAKHPEVQRKLQKELDEKISQHEPLNYETIHKMPYMDAVLKESLRLYPPVVGFLSRKCTKDCNIGGIHLPKGVEVMVLQRLIHEDEHYWEEPEKFNPDRFLNTTKDGQNPFAWLPFGAGPRNCIGMRFADLESKMLLFRLFSKHNVELGPGSSDPLPIQEVDFVMRPKNGVFVKLSKR